MQTQPENVSSHYLLLLHKWWKINKILKKNKKKQRHVPTATTTNLAARLPQLRHPYFNLQLSSAAMFNVLWNTVNNRLLHQQTQIYSAINYECSSHVRCLYQSLGLFCKGEQEFLAD